MKKALIIGLAAAVTAGTVSAAIAAQCTNERFNKVMERGKLVVGALRRDCG